MTFIRKMKFKNFWFQIRYFNLLIGAEKLTDNLCSTITLSLIMEFITNKMKKKSNSSKRRMTLKD